MKNLLAPLKAMLRTCYFQKHGAFSIMIICTMFGVASLLLSACDSTVGSSQLPPSTQTQVATVAKNSASHEKLTSLHMFDSLNGWATTSSAILHTTSGGIQWNQFIPEQMRGHHPNTTFFLSATEGWVAFVNGSTVHVLHTSDSGNGWQEGTFAVSQPFDQLYIQEMTFADAHDGWILMHLGNAAGSEYDKLYRTTNGGQSWSAPSGYAGGGGHYTGISFLNASLGWLTGYNGSNTYPYFFATQNGGSSWQLQKLQPPANTNAQSFYTTLPPTFFSAQDGILPVTWVDDTDNTQHTNIYVTSDGGSSWASTASLTISQAENLRPSFYDVNHGWLLDTGKNILYTTSDGGQNWSTVTSPASNIIQIDFVASDITGSTGWAVPDDAFLYNTPNVGSQWIQTYYSIS